jgi:hypothetical protein
MARKIRSAKSLTDSCDAPRLDLRQIEDLVDERQQGAPRRVDAIGPIALIGARAVHRQVAALGGGQRLSESAQSIIMRGGLTSLRLGTSVRTTTVGRRSRVSRLHHVLHVGAAHPLSTSGTPRLRAGGDVDLQVADAGAHGR